MAPAEAARQGRTRTTAPAEAGAAGTPPSPAAVAGRGAGPGTESSRPREPPAAGSRSSWQRARGAGRLRVSVGPAAAGPEAPPSGAAEAVRRLGEGEALPGVGAAALLPVAAAGPRPALAAEEGMTNGWPEFGAGRRMGPGVVRLPGWAGVQSLEGAGVLSLEGAGVRWRGPAAAVQEGLSLAAGAVLAGVGEGAVLTCCSFFLSPVLGLVFTASQLLLLMLLLLPLLVLMLAWFRKRRTQHRTHIRAGHYLWYDKHARGRCDMQSGKGSEPENSSAGLTEEHKQKHSSIAILYTAVVPVSSCRVACLLSAPTGPEQSTTYIQHSNMRTVLLSYE